MNAENSSQENIDRILSLLTTKQKIALCSGRNDWDTKEITDSRGTVLIPSVKVADGPHGLRKTVGSGDNLGLSASEPSTCFPAESLLACSFDRTIAGEMGAAIAGEARSMGVSTVLGPGANMKRDPRCGRNFEYLSEDPFLAGRMAAAYIQGVQSRGIGASLKHFACNSQEYFRMLSSSEMDERTLREIYLAAFEYAVKTADPATVMCAYNRLNGINCSDNEYLLDTILRKEWGYKGMVVSDWGALNDRVRAFRAGCDLIMPGGSAYGETDTLQAVQNGTLPERFVDRSAARVAAFAIRQKALLEDDQFSDGLSTQDRFSRSHEIARRIAEKSMVLLRNEANLLPLKESDEVCVIGSMAAENFRFQGSGSSRINPTRIPVPLARLRETFGSPLAYAPGYDAAGNTCEALLCDALDLAKKAKKVLVFVGLPEQFEAEGMDRRHIRLPDGQNRLIAELTKVNQNIIVVLVTGCVVELPWANEVGSILWAGLSGQAGDEALVNILLGKVSPSGRLAETWPMAYSDCPTAETYLNGERNAHYAEGIYMGYRYYEKKNIPVRFAFGHGLSYTTFACSDLCVSEKNGKYSISVTATNTGTAAGESAILFYIRSPQNGIHRPLRELKGFEKIYLAPGERRTVYFTADSRSFAVWNRGWQVYEGEYTFEVETCRSSAAVPGKVWDGTTDEEVHSFCPPETAAGGKYTPNSTLSEIKDDVALLRMAYTLFEKKQANTFGRDSVDYLAAMSSANECPLRTIQTFLKLKHHFAQAMADFGNRNYGAGVKHLFR